MITITRTAAIAPGKLGTALSFAHEVSRFIKEKHGTAIEVLMPVGGNPNRVAWHMRMDSLGAWEVLMGKLLADKSYLEMLSKNSDNFLPGSVLDEFWRSM
jgi:hypothetical protein